MSKKRIFKNHCDDCRYDTSIREGELCLCGLCRNYDDTDEPGCNYKPSTLEKLFRYTRLETSNNYPWRYYGLFCSWEQAKKDIDEKGEKGEEISEQESEHFRYLSEELRAIWDMDFDHKRCNYIRLINELDEKGEFKRLLKKLGRYPEFIDDFTIGIEKGEM